jgi:hypothetical protein
VTGWPLFFAPVPAEITVTFVALNSGKELSGVPASANVTGMRGVAIAHEIRIMILIRMRATSGLFDALSLQMRTR